MLDIQDLEFGYMNGTEVLKEIGISLDKAQLVSILGPNGVGKSTLMHCINRILTPTKGLVKVDGNDVKGYPMRELARKIGYVPCTTSDVFPLTVVDTVLMGRFPHNDRRPRDEDFEKVYRVLERLDIADLAMRMFNQLSAGQRQKVALARGLVQEPRILLLDEPTSNLDIKYQLEVTRLLRDLTVENGMLAIMISHDLNIASKYSDSIIMMHSGRVFAVGTPGEVITDENIRLVYDVESRVIYEDGRPHVILKDSASPAAPGIRTPYCSGPSTDAETTVVENRSVRGGSV